jgi:hypothetical protein
MDWSPNSMIGYSVSFEQDYKANPQIVDELSEAVDLEYILGYPQRFLIAYQY